MASTLSALALGLSASILSFLSPQTPLLPMTNTSINNTALSHFETTLQPLLSPTAQICHQNAPCFTRASSRWSPWHAPSFGVVVAVATPGDVAETVKAARGAGLGFLAIGGGHGATRSLGKMRGGVGVWMGGRVVRVGGGVLSGALMRFLAGRGLEGVTGVCECTSAIAPLLGGGHGWLQGRYGLMADNLLSAEVVIANGSVVTVSGREHEDLFWALRGAGQNFGVVVRWDYRVFEMEGKGEGWSWEEWGFGALVLHLSILSQTPTFPTHLTTALHSLSPLHPPQTGHGDLPAYSDFSGLMTMSGPFCTKNISATQRMPASLQRLNATALLAAAEMLANLPKELQNSALLIEAFSLEAVQAIPSASTAYPDRQGNYLLSPFITHPPHDANFEEIGEVAGRRIQDILFEGDGKGEGERRMYVNYAHGYETLEEVYGEGWRVERLRGLKRRWDPEGAFGFYVPIA
ncbi:hypothetical protein M409DRAFT_66888 [Zasmidium cellare ATCC 36951]|uniref:FAD-binding PCMH-type domain-containing protein n=1 Tax=Zasmidium cellare ATCC 36951 TaxID=1080233 RepID=A0A6A6CJ30_ZASCE|nr:uncharacterized protein M409DRAFT_66888 [Zasmidium cellare ATCC 36951]KAF2165952.1 hypothetical protein M409DRAFT_66888 [Zasmidium cellare ATCC 36951]